MVRDVEAFQSDRDREIVLDPCTWHLRQECSALGEQEKSQLLCAYGKTYVIVVRTNTTTLQRIRIKIKLLAYCDKYVLRKVRLVKLNIILHDTCTLAIVHGHVMAVYIVHWPLDWFSSINSKVNLVS